VSTESKHARRRKAFSPGVFVPTRLHRPPRGGSRSGEGRCGEQRDSTEDAASRCRFFPATANRPPRPLPRPTLPEGGCSFLAIFVAALLLLVTGCGGTPEVETEYGRRRASTGDQSVAGTSALARMFEAAGYSVASEHRITPRLNDYDIIVWTPDDFEHPRPEVQAFFERWMWDGYDRRLIVIGRDYDAASEYWQYAATEAPPEQARAAALKAARLRSEYHVRRGGTAGREKCRWFRYDYDALQARVSRLSGVLAAGVPPQEADIRLWARVIPPWELPQPDDEGADEDMAEDEAADSDEEMYADGELYIDEDGYYYDDGSGDEVRILDDDYGYWGFDVDRPVEYGEVLLAGDDDEPLVMELDGDEDHSKWSGGRIIVVTNGSFLLNLPLANSGNRRLAANLIEYLPDHEHVAFLETEPNPRVYKEEPYEGMPTGLQILTSYPTGPILMHFAVLGLLYLIARAPIFGRPRSIVRSTTADFGNHVAALGRLLSKGRDHAFMERRIREYHQRVRGDAEFELVAAESHGAAEPYQPAAQASAPSIPHSETQ
jgi:hypothetical protein